MNFEDNKIEMEIFFDEYLEQIEKYIN